MNFRSLAIIGTAFISLALMAFAADTGEVWDDLADVRFTIQYNEELGYDVEVPIFGAKAKALSRKTIIVSGFIIPLDGGQENDHFWLSKFPLQACFFCGKAGPETVIEVYSKKNITITKKKVTLKGKLQLNYDNLEQMIYVMQDGELVN